MRLTPQTMRAASFPSTPRRFVRASYTKVHVGGWRPSARRWLPSARPGRDGTIPHARVPPMLERPVPVRGVGFALVRGVCFDQPFFPIDVRPDSQGVLRRQVGARRGNPTEIDLETCFRNFLAAKGCLVGKRGWYRYAPRIASVLCPAFDSRKTRRAAHLPAGQSSLRPSGRGPLAGGASPARHEEPRSKAAATTITPAWSGVMAATAPFSFASCHALADSVCEEDGSITDPISNISLRMPSASCMPPLYQLRCRYRNF